MCDIANFDGLPAKKCFPTCKHFSVLAEHIICGCDLNFQAEHSPRCSKFKVHCITLFGIALQLHQHNKTENTQKHRNTHGWDKYKFCGVSTSRPDPLSLATYPEEATHLTVSDKLDSTMSIVLAATCARLRSDQGSTQEVQYTSFMPAVHVLR